MQIRPTGKREWVRVHAFYLHKGQTPARPPGGSIIFGGGWRDWRWLGCDDLILIVDGERMPLKGSHNGSVSLGGVSESVSAFLTVDQMLTIGNANRIEAMVCRDEFDFSEAQIAALRDWASRLVLSAPQR